MKKEGLKISPLHSTNDLQILPHNLEAERALLGAIMVRPEAMYDIMDIVTPEFFYSPKHGSLFKTMLELFSRGEPIDVLTLSSRLREHGLLEQSGGLSYLSELVHNVPSSANVEHYAQIVQNKHTVRKLILAAQEIQQLGFQEAEEIDMVLDSAEKKVFDIAHGINNKKFVHLKDVLSESLEQFEKMGDQQGLRGIPTGFTELDSKLSGFNKSDLIILAARPSVGKTAFALDIARRVAVNHNLSVAYFSLEMSAQQLVDRMVAAQSMLDAWKLRTFKLKTDKEFEQLRNAADALSKASIYIDDTPGNTILKMRASARRMKSQKGLDLIIVDYLQLMLPSGAAKNSDSMVFQVTEISRSLKNLARELNVPVIALSQLNRAIEQRGGKPRLSDLRDSGSIEQDADIVAFLHRERRDDATGNSSENNKMDIIIAKHRSGPIGEFQLYFDNEKASFRSIDTKRDFDGF